MNESMRKLKKDYNWSKKIVVILVLILISLTGCGSKKEDTLTFSVLYNESQDNPYMEDWAILEEYKDKKNVVLDIRLGDNDDYETAIKLNLEAEFPPDVILKVWPETMESFANDGLLLALSDYEHLMPNFKAYIEKNNLQNEIEELKLANGKYYILPGYQRDLQVQQWIYRQDIFEENSISMPTTYDELFESLVILKTIYPQSTPMTASWGGAHLLSMMGAGYGIPAGWSGTRYYNEENDEWRYSPATDNYRELYRFLNKSYAAGILDEAIFDQTNEQFIEKIVNGKAFVTVTWVSSGFDTWNEQLEENGILNGKWVALPAMESTIGITALPPVNRFRKGLIVSASAATKPYFEDMLKFLDWAIYSEEGIELSYWGIEGMTFETTSDGNKFLPDIITSKNLNGTIRMNEYGFNTIFNLCEDEKFEDNKKPDDIVIFLENSENANETLENSPKLILTNDAIEMISIIGEDLAIYVNDASIMFITGELEIDEGWDMYLARIDELGYKILENIWNTAWIDQNE